MPRHHWVEFVFSFLGVKMKKKEREREWEPWSFWFACVRFLYFYWVVKSENKSSFFIYLQTLAGRRRWMKKVCWRNIHVYTFNSLISIKRLRCLRDTFRNKNCNILHRLTSLQHRYIRLSYRHGWEHCEW